MKKKKLAAPLILLLVLALLIGGYLILKNHNEKKAQEESVGEEKEKITVIDKSDLTMTSLKIGNENLNFSYVNDVWLWAGDEKFPLDPDQMRELDVALSEVSAEVAVKEPGELSEYGLLEPVMTIEAEFSDGTSCTYKFGDVNDFNGYQYFTVSGDSTVYMLDQAVGEKFNIELDSLIKTDECHIVTDSIQAKNVTSILISTPEKTNDITDEDGINDLFTPVYAMNLSDWEDYYADEAEMKEKYGIGDSSPTVTITYEKTEEATNSDGNPTTVKVPYTYTVTIGNRHETAEKDEEGNPVSVYYYTCKDSSIVYKVDAEKVEETMKFLDYVPGEDEDTEAEETEIAPEN